MSEQTNQDASFEAGSKEEGCPFPGFMARMMENFCAPMCKKMMAHCAAAAGEEAAKPFQG